MKDGYCATPELRLAIRRSGRTVRSLAAELGYSKSHLYAVVRGDVPLRRAVAERIAQVVGADFSALFAVVTG
jgi:hypothetical protein